MIGQFKLPVFITVFCWMILSAANAKALGTISLDQASFTLGTSEVSLSKIELSGAESSVEELRALFSATDPNEFQERLKHLSAASLKIGELKQTQKISEDVSTSITRNVEITGIKDGIATLIRAEGGIFGGTTKLGDSHSGTFGAYSLADVDLPLIIRLSFGAKAQPSDTYAQAYSSAIMENIVFAPATGPSGSIEKVTLKKLAVKEIEGGFVSLVERIGKTSEKPEITDADKTRLALDFATLFDSFSIGSLEFVGFKLQDPKDEEFSAKINRITFAGASPDNGATIRMEGFDISGPEGHLRIGTIGQSGFDISPTLQKLREQLSKSGAKIDDLNANTLLPVLGRFELRDVAFETLQPTAIKAGIRSLDVTIENPQGGIPVGISASVDGLFGPFPTDPNDEASQTMIGLGYRDFDLSGNTKLYWNAPESELMLDVALSGANIGAVRTSSRIGGLTQDMLLSDPANAAIYAMAATIKTATVEIENRGLAERLIDQDAIKTKRTPEQVKKAYASVAAASLQLYLGASDTAMRLTRSIVKFVENPGKLSITAQSKSKDGVGIADTTLAEGPGAVIDLFDITTSSD